MNAGIEAIERVIPKVEAMEVEVMVAKRVAATATIAATTASNKVDELKKVVDSKGQHMGQA
jgi:hypothetical protein